MQDVPEYRLMRLHLSICLPLLGLPHRAARRSASRATYGAEEVALDWLADCVVSALWSSYPRCKRLLLAIESDQIAHEEVSTLSRTHDLSPYLESPHY